MSKRLLITGADGFTGRHLSEAAARAGFEVFPLQVDLTDPQAVLNNVLQVAPTHIAHLAAISAVTHTDALAFYQVNVLGTQYLLDAAVKLTVCPKRILLASSANVYGNIDSNAIKESSCPQPVNHYAISKLAMEHLAASYVGNLPLVVVRPFNYTGAGHDARFVVPKIVTHFATKAPFIELGNIFVEREFNDVRGVCERYLSLLDLGEVGAVYNICSGNSYSLQNIVQILTKLSGHEMEVRVNPAFVRANEIERLSGCPERLNNLIGEACWPDLENTLRWMYNYHLQGL